MRRKTDRQTEAVSPVIGVILMVAITVILAAVIGTFVLGLGENVSSASSAGVTLDEEPGVSVTFTIVDAGNLDGAVIVGPDGQRSAKATDTVQSGVKVIIQEGGFDNDSLINVSSETKNLINSRTGYPTGSIPDYLVGPDEECIIRHGENVVRDVPVGGADIGCSAKVLEQLATDATGIDRDVSGSDIPYETGAEYQLIGETDGEQNVIQSVETSEG